MSIESRMGPLDPAFAAAVEQLPPLGTAHLRREDLPASRALHAEIQAKLNADVSDTVGRRDEIVPGDAPVTVRVHRPKAATGPLPCILWMHGGGYIRGSHRIDDLRFDRWCRRFACMAITVDYRLAPEHPYPAALDDGYAALQWAHANADTLGIAPGAIGVGGASAGGGLAAALALYARDRDTPRPAFQMLVYPMLDDRQATPTSGWEVPVWGPDDNAFGWRSYLGPLYGGEVPAYAAPARAEDLRDLPPALVTVGALDGFADESIVYAQRLNQAGVPTELHVYPGAPHGFDYLSRDATLTRRFHRDVEEWLRTVLDRMRHEPSLADPVGPW